MANYARSTFIILIEAQRKSRFALGGGQKRRQAGQAQKRNTTLIAFPLLAQATRIRVLGRLRQHKRAIL